MTIGTVRSLAKILRCKADAIGFCGFTTEDLFEVQILRPSVPPPPRPPTLAVHPSRFAEQHLPSAAVALLRVSSTALPPSLSLSHTPSSPPFSSPCLSPSLSFFFRSWKRKWCRTRAASDLPDRSRQSRRSSACLFGLLAPIWLVQTRPLTPKLTRPSQYEEDGQPYSHAVVWAGANDLDSQGLVDYDSQLAAIHEAFHSRVFPRRSSNNERFAQR